MALYLGNTYIGSCNINERIEEKDVNFYDYEGTLVASYTKQEALAMTVLPPLPDRTSENLTNEGWNWTLAEIKEQLTDVGGKINIGCTYYTTDGKTYLYLRITPKITTVSIRLVPSTANDVTINWGDGTSDTIESATDTTTSHTYSNINIATDVCVTIDSQYSYSTKSYLFADQPGNSNSGLRKALLSNKISLYSDTFVTCRHLQAISIPKTVDASKSYIFSSCISLKHINIGYSSVGSSYFLKYCYSIKRVSFPNVFVSSGELFRDCRCLEYVTIPYNTTSLASGSMFYYCVNLKSIIVPSTVTSIGNSCFRECSTLTEVYVMATTPPTLGTRVFENTSPNLSIFVPRASLATYKSETNWSDWSSNIYPYDFN